jgi:GTP pyrophosphokinase
MELLTKSELLDKLKYFNLDTDEQILKALDVAEKIHQNQFRDSGNLYLEEHIYPLTVQVASRYAEDPDLKIIVITTILHDTIEDGDIEDGYVTSIFGEQIEKYVQGVTHKKVLLKEKPTQEMLFDMNRSLLEKVAKSGRVSIIVKLEDRLNNLSAVIVNPNKRDKYLRMIEEVKKLYIPLALNNGLKEYEKLFNDSVESLNKLLN